jgi:hypothetical protein
MFKEKSSKKKLNIDNKEISTLDAMHNKMIKTFENNNQQKKEYQYFLDKYTKINDIISNQLNYYKQIQDKDQIQFLCTSNICVKENIIQLKLKISELDNFDEIEYYKNASDILFQYYDTVEKQSSKTFLSQPLQYSEYKIKKPETKKKKQIVHSINVLDALNNYNIPVQNNCNNICLLHTSNNILIQPPITNESTNNIHQALVDKSTLVDQYLSIVNKHHIKTIYQEDIETCRVCKTSMTCLQHDAIMICNNCGYQELLLVEQNRPILKQNTKDTSHFSYKRINHFREWCNQVQGKESTDIPDEIFEKILNEIKKEKITDTKTITYNKMRDILKRLRINKYYEHINYIINRINGIPTPQFSPELEEKLCNMFRNIQGPFLKHCPKDRKNFLSYSYVLYKFFQILGLHEYLKYFPLLKSREKLYVQDQIWRKICKELNYEIIPSL